MKKTIWKNILCAMLVVLTACILCTGAFAAKYDSYDDGYDAIYDDDDYDEDRYDSDPDYAAGVDDAMDELDW